MGYDNNNGGCCGGWGFPFGGFMNGFGGLGFDALLLFLFFGLMGGGMWGGMGGWGMGGMGWGGGAGMLGATSLAATETAALINQQNTADRVAAANAKADAIAGIVTANGQKLETVKDAVTNGFFANQTNLCQLGNNIAMQAVNNHNNLTSQLTDMRFAQSQCCCETKQQIADLRCSLTNEVQSAKAEILGAMQAQRMAELEAKNIELKGQISQANQTAAIVAAVQANGCAPKCQPFGPCGPYTGGYAYTPYPCNPCVDGVQRAVNNALGERIGEILFPTTPAAATA